MSGFTRVVLVGTGVGVVVAVGVIAAFVVDWGPRVFKRIDSPREAARYREQELSRRAQRPTRTTLDENGHPPMRASYDRILEGWEDNRPRPTTPAEPMPPTVCRSVETVPKDPEGTSGPHEVHYLTFWDFVNASGFGFMRMGGDINKRGMAVASEHVDRVELVSLLTQSEPSVYVLDEVATPPVARKAKRRPLDEFEQLGLAAVRRGEELVWTREAPTRMFGAIRAKAECIDCHVNAKEGDLLGAFTYYLDTPVDEIAKREQERQAELRAKLNR